MPNEEATSDSSVGTARISFLEASLNIISCIVGSGIVGFPYAVARSGIFLGTILTLGTALAIDFSIRLLIHSAAFTKTCSYPQLMQKIWGKWGFWAVGTFQILSSFGGICIDMIMIRDNLSNLIFAVPLYIERSSEFPVPSSSSSSQLLWVRFSERWVVVPLVGFGVIFPLSMLRHVKDFAVISLISVVGTILLVACAGICCFGFCTTADEQRASSIHTCASSFKIHWTSFMGSEIHWFRWNGAIETVSIVCFAFICHGVVFSIYNSLKVPSLGNFGVIVHTSMVFCCVIFGLLGIPAYLRFKDDVEGNILNNFSYTNPLINVVRGIFTVSLATSVPLEVFAIREVLNSIDSATNGAIVNSIDGSTNREIFNSIDYSENARISSNSNIHSSSPIKKSLNDCIWKRAAVSLGIVSLAVAIASSKLQVTDFLAVTGGVAASCVAFIFPGGCFLASALRNEAEGGIRGQKKRFAVAIAILVFGMWVFWFSTADLVEKISQICKSSYFLTWK